MDKKMTMEKERIKERGNNGGSSENVDAKKEVDGEKREKISSELPTVEFKTKKGRRIVRLSVNTLPHLYNSIYVVFSDDAVYLVDMGFMMDIERFFEKFRSEITQKYSVEIEEIKGIFVTHAHIDHFGGLFKFKEFFPKTEIYIHELDSKAVERFEEVFAYARYYFRIFFARAGLDEEGIKTYMSMYSASKEVLRSVKVNHVLSDGEYFRGFKIIHTPGHSPGHICIIFDDVIFTGDHILPYITPHQFPESIMKWTGVGHYLESLDKVRNEVVNSKISFGLPAHYTIIEDVVKRIDEIKKHHARRLREVHGACKNPITIVEATRKLFPDKERYQFILALDEVAAHIEYLWDRGYISISNLDDFIKNDFAPIKWIASRELPDSYNFGGNSR